MVVDGCKFDTKECLRASKRPPFLSGKSHHTIRCRRDLGPEGPGTGMSRTCQAKEQAQQQDGVSANLGPWGVDFVEIWPCGIHVLVLHRWTLDRIRLNFRCCKFIVTFGVPKLMFAFMIFVGSLEAFSKGSGKYMLHTAPSSLLRCYEGRWKLKCTEVIVHSGGVSSGHYYTFVRVRESCFFASSRLCWLGETLQIPSEFSSGPRWFIEVKARVNGSSLTTMLGRLHKTPGRKQHGIHVLNIGCRQRCKFQVENLEILRLWWKKYPALETKIPGVSFFAPSFFTGEVSNRSCGHLLPSRHPDLEFHRSSGTCHVLQWTGCGWRQLWWWGWWERIFQIAIYEGRKLFQKAVKEIRVV